MHFNPRHLVRLLQALLLTLPLALTSTAAAVALPNPATTTTTTTPPPPDARYPTRSIAGVSLIDTPLVRAAHDLAYQQYGAQPFIYGHVMRSWLFGALLLSHNGSLASRVDREVHAVAVLLHDLGWVRGSPFVSPDKRFEVDGAEAAREFVRNFTAASASAEGVAVDYADWSSDESRKLQLVWDAIALHTQKSIAAYKEPVVAATCNGIMMEFFGPSYGVEQAEYDAVLAAFPADDFLPRTNETFIWLAETKPETTYGEFCL
ncbi:hypothetical protein TruAng_005151 [Truncatella angustata]|nr:hypothetical protein TruAng_005151 [Truncatella angustata]